MDNVIITNVNLYAFDIPLTQTLRIGGKSMSSRQGLILAVTDSLGTTGFGEISPLPGLNTETLSQIVMFFKELHRSWPDDIRIAENKILSGLGIDSAIQWNKWPSVRFGVTGALADLLSRNAAKPVCQFWPGTPKEDTIRINALITYQDDVGFSEQYLRDYHYTSVKIKVGHAVLAEDIARINDMRILLGPDITIRIDANRSWTYQEACKFIGSVTAAGIEYIEEPLKDPAELPRLIETLNCPVALDESLPSWTDRASIPEGIAALILKPAMIGSIDENLRWIDFARNKHITPVISDTFHSGVGMQMLLNLAVYAGGERIPMGLDTYRWLSRDVLQRRLPLPAGILKLSDLDDRHASVRIDTLKKIF